MQYIFLHISRRALDARKFDVHENYNHNRTNRIKWYVRKNEPSEYAYWGLMRKNLGVRKYLGKQYTVSNISLIWFSQKNDKVN